ncbi:MAG: hypothetical protein ACKKL4_00390 [Patescibacteria group bacterium]
MSQLIVGLSLIILGSLTMLEHIGVIEIIVGWRYISSLLVIILGVYLLIRAKK